MERRMGEEDGGCVGTMIKRNCWQSWGNQSGSVKNIFGDKCDNLLDIQNIAFDHTVSWPNLHNNVLNFDFVFEYISGWIYSTLDMSIEQLSRLITLKKTK